MITTTPNPTNQNPNRKLQGPKEPIWYQTIWGVVQPLSYLDSIQKRYGDICLTPPFAGLPAQVVISNPQALQEIFTADASLFESGSGSQMMQPLVGDNSLLLMDGTHHLQQRKLLMPPFHGERMKAYGQTICEITQKVTEKITVGQKIIVRPLMQQISLNVILRTIFGIKEGKRYQQIENALIATLKMFDNPLNSAFLFFKPLQRNLGILTPWGNFLKQRELLDKLLYQEIRERRAQIEYIKQEDKTQEYKTQEHIGEDILSLLISARDENGQGMTDLELRDELMTMLFAGHETTANALTWALYWIHYLPEVKEKLLRELSSIDIDNADAMEIMGLPYLNAVCSETLRIYPIVFFTLVRILQAPMQLMGYDLPAGMVLSPCIYLTHHNPKIYPEPKKFRPERFLERKFSPYEYLPFGGGNRRCLGSAFAMFEMKLALATILSNYSFSLAEKRPLKPLRRGITFTPSGGLRLIVNS